MCVHHKTSDINNKITKIGIYSTNCFTLDLLLRTIWYAFWYKLNIVFHFAPFSSHNMFTRSIILCLILTLTLKMHGLFVIKFVSFSPIRMAPNQCPVCTSDQLLLQRYSNNALILVAVNHLNYASDSHPASSKVAFLTSDSVLLLPCSP
jgi:hypothetical protein